MKAKGKIEGCFLAFFAANCLLTFPTILYIILTFLGFSDTVSGLGIVIPILIGILLIVIAFKSEWRGSGEFQEKGNAHAQFDLGLSYHMGEGVPKNLATAAEWYRKSAEQGDVRAQLFLGTMYADGEGVVMDKEQAIKWIRKSADRGYASAQFNLAMMYVNGEGVTKNLEAAVEWLRKSAEQGNADAQCSLGLMYDKGEGVMKNIETAVEWYRKSAEQGDEYSCKALKILGY